MAFKVSDPIQFQGNRVKGNLDDRFGPYNFDTDINTTLQNIINSLKTGLANLLAKGLKVGIIIDNKIVEYTFQGDPSNPKISDFEHIVDPKDLKYSDGTSFLDENGNINSDPTIDPLPSHGSSENGKVLGLDNKGSLTWVSQPDISGKANIGDSYTKTESDTKYLTAQNISGKADKVNNATANDFAALDGNGNLIDSGKKSSDFATSTSVTAVQNQVSTIQGNYVKTTTSGGDPVMDSSFDPANDCVRVDETQNLTEAKKQIARSNINAINGNDLKTINGQLLVGNGNLVIRSAYEEWLAAGNTGYEQEFLASLKAQFGSFVPADYGTDGVPASGGSDITASANTTNYIYLVDNDATTPTAKTMWVTVVDDSDPVTYNWTSIGDVQVDLTFGSGQSVPATKIKDLNGEEVQGTAGVLSAEAGERMNSKLYGGNYPETNNVPINTLDSGYYNTRSASEGSTYTPSITAPSSSMWKCKKVVLEIGQSCKAVHKAGASDAARRFVVTDENGIVTQIGKYGVTIETDEFSATSETGKLNVYLNFYDTNETFEGQSLEKTIIVVEGGDIPQMQNNMVQMQEDIDELSESVSTVEGDVDTIKTAVGESEHDVVYRGADNLSNMYILNPSVSLEVIEGTARWKSYIVPIKPNTTYKFGYSAQLIVSFSDEPSVGSVGLRYWGRPDSITTSSNEHFLLLRRDNNNPIEITVTFPGYGVINDVKNLTGYKKILCLGDSITEFTDNSGARYSDYLSNLTGGEVVNGGFGGASFRQHAALDGYGGMDIVNVVKALCSGTFPSTPEVGVMQYTGSTAERTLENVSSVSEAVKTSFETEHYADYTKLSIVYTVDEVSITATIMVSSYSLVGTTLAYTSDYELMTTTNEWSNLIKSAENVALARNDDNRPVVKRLEMLDLSELEAITIFAGTNDWNVGGAAAGSESTIGTSGVEDAETTLGAIDIIIRLLSTTYPNIKLYWFTPIVRYVGSEWTPANWSDTVLRRGVTLKQFSALIENEVELFHIPVCDLYNTLGWNTYNFSNFFNDNDGTHPRKGMKWLAEKIYKFLQSH